MFQNSIHKYIQKCLWYDIYDNVYNKTISLICLFLYSTNTKSMYSSSSKLTNGATTIAAMMTNPAAGFNLPASLFGSATSSTHQLAMAAAAAANLQGMMFVNPYMMPQLPASAAAALSQATAPSTTAATSSSSPTHRLPIHPHLHSCSCSSSYSSSSSSKPSLLCVFFLNLFLFVVFFQW